MKMTYIAQDLHGELKPSLVREGGPLAVDE